MKRILILALLFATVPCVSRAADAPAASPTEQFLAGLLGQAPGLKPDALRLALKAEQNAAKRGLVKRTNLLTVIDYSIPSTQPRLFVFDLARHKLLFRELCAHGKNSGGVLTSFFSNDPGSEATSLGLFVTADTYVGGNGVSLRLRGLEQGFNDMAWDRMIVLHGASYVSQEAIKVLGRLGRSWGCPAVPQQVAQKIINTIRGGSAVFAYYPDKQWLSSSAFLH
jgi:L,D-transpeptidase catalytic domain